MENILKDVNRNVGRPEPKQSKGLADLLARLKLDKLKSGAKKVASEPKPAAMIALAVVACLSLAAAAFFAFGGGSGKRSALTEVTVVGTTAAAGDSIQAAGGSLVSPQEIEDLSNALKKQIGSTNENQDFNPEPLTDQALGL
jgi:hypothetical protein